MRFQIAITAIFITVTLLMNASAAPAVEGAVTVFDLREAGSRYYRIPAIVKASDGSLVALADRRGDSPRDLPNTISVVAKRSCDGGRTWGDMVTVARGDSVEGLTYGDPAVVCDRESGTLVSVFSGDNGYFYSNAEKRAGYYVARSYDDGLTWEEPRAITDMVYQPGWEGSFCSSGRILQTSSGQILFASPTRLSQEWDFKDIYVFVCCSSDGGETWEVLNPESRVPSDGKGNESKIAELPDGSLLLSMRHPGYRRFSYSHDGGKTWSQEEDIAELMEPDCNGDIITVRGSDGMPLLLHSLPADARERRDVSIYVSNDGGTTWPGKYQLSGRESGYSSLVEVEDGVIGCLYEEGSWDEAVQSPSGYRIVFRRIPIEELEKSISYGHKDIAVR